MKKIMTISGAVLLAAASLGFAGGLEELRTAAGPGIEASADAGLPMPSKSGFVVTEDYGTARIFVKATGGVRASVGAAYTARKDSYFCTELSWNEGSMERVPKRIYPEFAAQNGLITVPGAMAGGCDYGRASEGSLSLSIPGRAEAYSSLALIRGGVSGEEQSVVCEIIQAGNSAGEQLYCRGDVRLDASGQARVRVTLKEAGKSKAAEALSVPEDPKDISGDKLVQFGSVCALGQNQADAVSRASLVLNEPFVRLRTDVNAWNGGAFSGTYVRAPYRVIGEATVSKVSSIAKYNWVACIPVQGSPR
ncbi:MAG: hypothetical protein A2081_02150 [Elusimicrobia bacterium GWC2_61_19]|nr:MAG: hypothetical protein A2081_02150 [Elusimicrobia bacterium GWC2_61_19]